MRAALSISACLLVFASAGFGCVYAYTQASHHGPALAVLAVAMALGLEVAKPFAVESVFSCLRRLAIGRALAVLALAAVAIAYSLTAELSLMAATRGDATASREAVADARQMAKERHRRAIAELASLAPSRPAGELRAMVGGQDCTRPANSRARALCGELARAERRVELQAVIDTAERETVSRPAVATGDAGALALATVLGMLGVAVPAGALASWLVLVGVLALEAGSSLAVVLVCSAERVMVPPAPVAKAPVAVQELPHHVALDPVKAAPALPEPQEPATIVAPVSKKSAKAKRGRPARERKEAEAKVVSILRTTGPVSGTSTRKLAKAAGVRKSTMHAALAGLLAAGVIVKTAAGIALGA